MYCMLRALPLFTNEKTVIRQNTLLITDKNEMFNEFKPEWHIGNDIAPGIKFAVGIGTELMEKSIGTF